MKKPAATQYSTTYHEAEDLLAIAFDTPHDIPHAPDVSEDILVGREPTTGRIRALAIPNYRLSTPERLNRLQLFLKLFDVTLPRP